MVKHDYIAKEFAFELMTIEIQAIQNRYDEGRRVEDFQTSVNVCCDVVHRAFHANSWIHDSPYLRRLRSLTQHVSFGVIHRR